MEKSIRIVSYIVGFILVAVLVQTLTATKFAGLKEKNGYYSRDVVSIKTREQQLDCLAINIYREAGYEPFEGKVAVAQVTLNRVQAGVFGKDVCGVPSSITSLTFFLIFTFTSINSIFLIFAICGFMLLSKL